MTGTWHRADLIMESLCSADVALGKGPKVLEVGKSLGIAWQTWPLTTSDYDVNDRVTLEQIIPGTSPLGTVSKTVTYEYGTLDGNGDVLPGTTLARKTTWQGTDTDTATGVKLDETRFHYNLQGRTASIENETFGTEASLKTTRFTYDHAGMRLSQTVDDGSTVKTTTYIVDANNPTGYAQVIEELTIEGAAQTRTSYTIGLDVIAQQSTTFDGSTWTMGTLLTLLYDGHGSTRALLEGVGAAANIASGQIFTYDAYGQMLARFDGQGAPISVTPLTTLLYSGEQTDSTGLQYLRARYYDPASGRFTTMDPFAGSQNDPQSLHKYLYGHGNPIGNVDPSGESILDLALRSVYFYSGLLNSALGWYEATVNNNANSAYLYYSNAVVDFALAFMVPPGAGTAAALNGGRVLRLELISVHASALAIKNLFIYAVANSPGHVGSFLPEGGSRQIPQRETSHDVGVHLGREYLTNQRGLKETSWVNPFELIGKFGQGFDDILEDTRNGILYIVEYKGGASKLVGDQMERSWVVRNIERLAREAPNNPWGQRLQNALVTGKLRGIVVETPYSPSTGSGITKITKDTQF